MLLNYIYIALLVILIMLIIWQIIKYIKTVKKDHNSPAVEIVGMFTIMLIVAIAILIVCIGLQVKTTEVKMTEQEYQAYQNFINNDTAKIRTVSKENYEKYLEAKKATEDIEKSNQIDNDQPTITK